MSDLFHAALERRWKKQQAKYADARRKHRPSAKIRDELNAATLRILRHEIEVAELRDAA